MAEPGFEIYGTTYPVVQRWRVTDPVLVREITGMDWLDFAEAAERMQLEDPADPNGAMAVDQVVMAGMIAVSYWQANPRLSRRQVVRFMENLPLEAVTMVGGDDEDEPDEPEEGGEGNVVTVPEDSGSSLSETPGKQSPPSEDGLTGLPIPVASGVPGSDTGSPE